MEPEALCRVFQTTAEGDRERLNEREKGKEKETQRMGRRGTGEGQKEGRWFLGILANAAFCLVEQKSLRMKKKGKTGEARQEVKDNIRSHQSAEPHGVQSTERNNDERKS